MNLQEYQIEARKTAHHTSHLGLEYLTLKLCGEAGELVTEMVRDVQSRDLQLHEMGDVLWYVSEIYIRHGWVLAVPAAITLPPLAWRTETWLLILLATTRLAEGVGKAMRRGMVCDSALVRRECEVILYYLEKAARLRGSAIEQVADLNVTKLAARQAAGTVLGGDR